MPKIVFEGKEIRIEFSSPEDAYKFLEFLRALGITNNIEKKEIKLEYEEKFKDYLIKDRGIDKRTARSYVNYLKKLEGETIDYNLYLKILDNKWKVKLVRIYLDYLYKTGKITWEDKERLKSIFKVKRNNNEMLIKGYELDIEELLDKYLLVNENTLYQLILNMLLYSGARLSEVVKMLREFDEKRLVCYEDFCRYFLGWYRGRKRCDYIYFPKKLLPKLLRHIHKIGKYENLRKNIFDYYGIRPKNFRKLHYRLCRQILDKEICAFYQSRSSKLDVSDIHYDDLLSRADQKYPLLVKKIDKLINELKELDTGKPINIITVFMDEDSLSFNTQELSRKMGDLRGIIYKW